MPAIRRSAAKVATGERGREESLPPGAGGVAPRRAKRSTIRSREAREAFSMMAPAIVLLIVFLAIPFVLAIALSFTNERLLPRPIPTQFIGWRNYERIIFDEDFWQALWNTARFAVFVVPIQSALALTFAVLINTQLPGRNVFRGIYFTPTVITLVVVCVIWSSLLQAPRGLINGLVSLLSLGTIGPQDWLLEPNLALPTIMGISMWQGLGFQMIIYLAGLQGINQELYEAARVDGASRWQQFRYVTMPGLRNTHIFVLVTTTILAFKLFTQVEVLTRGGPLGTTNTLVRYIYVSGFREQRVAFAAAAAVIFFLIVLTISIVQRRLIAEEREVQ